MVYQPNKQGRAEGRRRTPPTCISINNLQLNLYYGGEGRN